MLATDRGTGGRGRGVHGPGLPIDGGSWIAAANLRHAIRHHTTQHNTARHPRSSNCPPSPAQPLSPPWPYARLAVGQARTANPRHTQHGDVLQRRTPLGGLGAADLVLPLAHAWGAEQLRRLGEPAVATLDTGTGFCAAQGARAALGGVSTRRQPARGFPG